VKNIFIYFILFCFVNSTLLFGKNKYYDDAQVFYDMVQFDEALKTLDDAIDKVENVNEDLIAIYLLKAKIYIVLNKETEAKNFFLKLLFLDGNYKINSDESPKIVEFFENVKKKFQESLTVKLSPAEILFTPVTKTEYKDKLPISVIISNMNESRDAKIFYRMIGYDKFMKSDLMPLSGDDFEGYIPLSIEQSSQDFMIEYFIGVLDFQGSIIAAYPDQSNPILLTVTVPEKITEKKDDKINNGNPTPANSSIFEKWWFWTIVIGVVGGGVGTYFLLNGDETKASTYSPSFTITLP